jgi:hypothetical protein
MTTMKRRFLRNPRHFLRDSFQGYITRTNGVATQQERDYGSKGLPTVGSRYLATHGEDTEDFLCAAVQ